MTDLLGTKHTPLESPGRPGPLPALRLGRLRVWPPVQLGALAGYSDVAMRTICRSFGAPLAVCEMVLDEALLVSKRIRRQMVLWPDDHPIVGQLLTTTAGNAAQAAQALVEMGYDAIDLNMACPVPKIIHKGRGGGLLREPSRAADQIRAVRAAIDPAVPLSLKLRIGWDESAASRDSLHAILDTAVEAGVAAVTIHGRYVVQRYKGRADWQALAAVRRRLGEAITLIGSGDVFSARDAFGMLETTGFDGVSIARGAIGKPWIFRQVIDLLEGRDRYVPDYLEQGAIMRRHFELAQRVYRNEAAVARHMRKFGIFYSRCHPHAKQVRLAFIAAGNAAEWNAVIDTWYSEGGPVDDDCRMPMPTE